MRRSFTTVELLGSGDTVSLARRLRARCSQLERCALRRAVLRSALASLEKGWCPGNAEHCDHPAHDAAWVAWDHLTRWDAIEEEREHEERGAYEERELLEFCLRESGRIPEAEIRRILDTTMNTAGWSDLVGGWIRDPLVERYDAARADYLAALRSLVLRDAAGAR
ncbi:hypothetical protein ACTWP5_15235 [Streptomyces sp. 4N509B]|uniref:hypothetical protein n=1 Tax=Streptomyces sp. 4N509B TaxID=3457413 RepID=UPI003FD4740D